MGRSLFDIIHPEDAEILKTQLLSSDHGPRERLIDIKTGVSIKTESSPSFLSSAGSRKMFYNIFSLKIKGLLQSFFVKTHKVHEQT